jgi:hypothetical protein
MINVDVLNKALEAYQMLNEDEEMEFNRILGLEYDIFGERIRESQSERRKDK